MPRTQGSAAPAMTSSSSDHCQAHEPQNGEERSASASNTARDPVGEIGAGLLARLLAAALPKGVQVASAGQQPLPPRSHFGTGQPAGVCEDSHHQADRDRVDADRGYLRPALASESLFFNHSTQASNPTSTSRSVRSDVSGACRHMAPSRTWPAMPGCNSQAVAVGRSGQIGSPTDQRHQLMLGLGSDLHRLATHPAKHSDGPSTNPTGPSARAW